MRGREAGAHGCWVMAGLGMGDSGPSCTPRDLQAHSEKKWMDPCKSEWYVQLGDLQLLLPLFSASSPLRAAKPGVDKHRHSHSLLQRCRDPKDSSPGLTPESALSSRHSGQAMLRIKRQ